MKGHFMPDPHRNPEETSLDPKIIAVVAVLAALYALIQHTELAPFPHAADDFVGGLAVGTAISSIINWLGLRR
jgi:hypothetical protein